YKVMCPFNATHRLFKTELEEHIITCPTRSVLESEIYTEPRNHGVTNFVSHSEISSTINCAENWDSEIDFNSTILTDDYFSCNNVETSKVSDNFSFKRNIDEITAIRGPRGFSEAMLRDLDEESYVEDVESIVSSMGIGRGKVTWNSNNLRLIGLGRGCPINTDLH
ncbi:hypothetical protein WH47_04007, partial [Habropoda laboriosa]